MAGLRRLSSRAVGDGLIKEADNPAQKVATLAAMLEPARPRRAVPGQALAAAAQQPSPPMTAPYRRDNGNPASSLISAPACYRASLHTRRAQREIRLICTVSSNDPPLQVGVQIASIWRIRIPILQAKRHWVLDDSSCQ